MFNVEKGWYAKTEEVWQKWTGPSRAYGNIFTGLGLAGVVAGPLMASVGTTKALAQMRDGAPNGEIQGNAQDTLDGLLREGKTHYGDMPGTTLSGEKIDGAEQIILGGQLFEYGVPLALFASAYATKTERATLAIYLVANEVLKYTMEKPIGQMLFETIVGI